jgi:hypothetical protein
MRSDYEIASLTAVTAKLPDESAWMLFPPKSGTKKVFCENGIFFVNLV